MLVASTQETVPVPRRDRPRLLGYPTAFVTTLISTNSPELPTTDFQERSGYFLLLVLKLLAVTTSHSSGNAGGIFGTSLFIGAMLVGVIGTVPHRLVPAYTASAGAYALVGMGAVFADVVRAPMTSVLMIFKMTQDYAVIVPLTIANLVSLFISSRLQRHPIYEALAVQDSIHLPKSETHHRHRDRQPYCRTIYSAAWTRSTSKRRCTRREPHRLRRV